MKTSFHRLFVLHATLLLAATGAMAQFTPGRVVVLQATNNANGGGGTLVEFTSSGPSGYTVTLPYNGATDNGVSIVFGNSSTLNHDISLSGDGALVIIGGFANTATGVDASSGTASPRVGATVKYDGTYARPRSSTTALSGTSIRSMTSDGFGNFWGNGNSGTIYLNSNTTIQTAASRVHAVFNGKLYYSTGAGAFELPGLPTTAAAGTLVLPTASMSGTATAVVTRFHRIRSRARLLTWLIITARPRLGSAIFTSMAPVPGYGITTFCWRADKNLSISRWIIAARVPSFM